MLIVKLRDVNVYLYWLIHVKLKDVFDTCKFNEYGKECQNMRSLVIIILIWITDRMWRRFDSSATEKLTHM